MACSQPSPGIAPCDALRTPELATQPDARCESFAIVDSAGVRKATLADRHAAVACYVLNATAPDAVRIHFETAKNLYLYAWFVYRFHPVAEQQALASLEFALRERLAPRKNPADALPRKPGLTGLLKQASKLGLIRNDALTDRRVRATAIARERYRFELSEEMARKGATEITFDDSTIQPTSDDLNHDWIAGFVEFLPLIRNTYAHGSEMLYPTVLHTFGIVCELINQLYPEDG